MEVRDPAFAIEGDPATPPAAVKTDAPRAVPGTPLADSLLGGGVAGPFTTVGAEAGVFDAGAAAVCCRLAPPVAGAGVTAGAASGGICPRADALAAAEATPGRIGAGVGALVDGRATAGRGVAGVAVPARA